QEIEHLRERQSNHDEADARGAQANRSNQYRHNNTYSNTYGKLDPAIADAVVSKYGHRIATQANKQGMAKADQAGKAQHDIQGARRERIDQDSRKEGYVKRFVQRLRNKRKRGKQHEQDRQAPARPIFLMHGRIPENISAWPNT